MGSSEGYIPSHRRWTSAYLGLRGGGGGRDSPVCTSPLIATMVEFESLLLAVGLHDCLLVK